MRVIGIHSSVWQMTRTILGSMLVVLIVYSAVWFRSEVKPAYVPYKARPQIIVDAGHGGIDGGAVGVNGVVEKEINLSIALKLKELLRLNGYDVILTRSNDDSIHDPAETSISGQKRSDMYNRMDIIKQYPNALFLSIHQNIYSDASCSGAQVFFSPNHAASESLAQTIQTSFRQHLQLNNTRQIKEAGDNLFLLYHAENPAVLVECGFLSNAEECALLCDESYQKKVACILYLSLLDFYSQT